MFILSGARKGPTATHKDVTAEIEIPVGQFRFRRFLVDGVVVYPGSHVTNTYNTKI